MTNVRPAFDDASLMVLRAREQSAPRYTSYPTALEMKAALDVPRYLSELQRSNRGPVAADLSVYVHLPFCASACYYCGCNRTISSHASRHARYLEVLKKEIQMLGKQVHKDRVLRQIHFGGGTPNLYPTDQLAAILEVLQQGFLLDEGCEISLEIDPRHAKVGDIAAWASFGVNRLSIGVQDADYGVQKAVNRVQSMAHIASLRAAARAADYSGVNFDLILGLPKQTRSSVARTVEQVIALRPERIAVFQYAHMPQRFAAQRAIRALDLPDMDARFTMQDEVRKRLLEAGYQHIGLDHYALTSDSLARAQNAGQLRRNFQGYTVSSDFDLLGLGVSAISQVGNAMVQNTHDIAAYEAAITAGDWAYARGVFQCEEDRRRASIIEELMCHGHTTQADPGCYPEAWQRLDQLDPQSRLVRRYANEWRVTSAGRAFLRLIAQCFDQYRDSAAPAQAQSIRSVSCHVQSSAKTVHQ